ncbi:MAG: ferritin [Bacteroidales bacterium]|nr:ferritin [Bacteroidales bacterium]
MLTQKMQSEYNKQINAEFYSAYLYLSMSSYLSENNLNGFANWMNIQYQEEMFHAMKFYQYVIERGGKVVLDAIEKPQAEWKDIIDVFESTFEHEKHVTSLVHNLMSVAHEEKDYASVSFLQWFVDEQVEEEANVDELLQQLKLVEGKGSGLFMLDREAKARVFTPPVAQ